MAILYYTPKWSRLFWSIVQNSHDYNLQVAMIDELENPQHMRQRFTVGY